ncbi:BsuPI-related putative proteinase inhibitor [Fictibacillus gelatini]|uniref:BsuPI-related putative proteinase inhibitor n=1 Tax=Fictibacillus gelatini TaxID=225985 RepID=UPI000686F6CB|nr:BsuPI-related putative proteinase inhibitor [Fictibacillus gelatini]
MKIWFVLLSMIVFLAGCGSTVDKKEAEKGAPVMGDGKKNEKRGEEPTPGEHGIIAGSIEPSLKVMEEKKGMTLLRYELKNQTEQVKVFQFKSGQKFDYIIKDKTGKQVYQYSKDHMFIQVLSKLQIKQGESWVQDIMVKNLEPGTYTITIWLTAKDAPKYEKSLTFEMK